MIKKGITVIFTLIILTFYFFPFQFRLIPVGNTKMYLAGIGLLVLGLSLGKNKDALINKGIFHLSVLASLISLAGLVSVVYNNTFDYTYTTYIISMWVWLSAAYVVVSLMKVVHGNVSVYIFCNYLIALCVFQCVLALLMEFCRPVENFIYSIIDEGTAYFLKKKDRMSGLGVGLDIAGSRFSAVLLMLSYICVHCQKKVSKYISLYIMAFLIISIVGNMIARTTSVGMIMAILYFVIATKFHQLNAFKKRLLICFSIILLISVPVLIYSYRNVPQFQQNIRFGFEGFFSLWDSGRWEVGSNEILQNMYIFPETVKTWLIGDGYFGSTTNDPFYTGKEWKGYYMATDVGYLRFIYYFGLLGLLLFIFFFIKTATICMNRFPTFKVMFLLLLVLNFIIWFKVSTDIFLVFAPFLCISKKENEAYERYLTQPLNL